MDEVMAFVVLLWGKPVSGFVTPSAPDITIPSNRSSTPNRSRIGRNVSADQLVNASSLIPAARSRSSTAAVPSTSPGIVRWFCSRYSGTRCAHCGKLPASSASATANGRPASRPRFHAGQSTSAMNRSISSGSAAPA